MRASAGPGPSIRAAGQAAQAGRGPRIWRILKLAALKPIRKRLALAIHEKTESISLALLDQAASAGIFRLPADEEADDAAA